MEPDAALLESALRAAQRGDVAGFNRIVEAFQRQVFNICYRTLGNSEDAADATQDAFLSAFRGLKTFQGSASGLRAWLMRVAVNACYDQLRRRQRRPADSLDALAHDDDDVSPAARVPDPGLSPEQLALGSETARQIQNAIDLLVPEQRMTVVLCDVQGLNYEEAAAAMGVELGTVKSRLSRARARLRELLLEKELQSQTARLEQRNP